MYVRQLRASPTPLLSQPAHLLRAEEENRKTSHDNKRKLVEHGHVEYCFATIGHDKFQGRAIYFTSHVASSSGSEARGTRAITATLAHHVSMDIVDLLDRSYHQVGQSKCLVLRSHFAHFVFYQRFHISKRKYCQHVLFFRLHVDKQNVLQEILRNVQLFPEMIRF